MKTFPLTTLTVIAAMTLLTTVRASSAAEASSNFDTGYDGWVPVSMEPNGGSRWSWQSEGGNGEGFVQFKDNLSAPLFNFLRAPATFTGDWSALDGTGELRYDFRLTGDTSGFRHTYVFVWGLDRSVMIFDQSRTGDFNDDWETISMPLVKSEWQIYNNSGTWEDILSNVTAVDIYPLYNGRDYGRLYGIDNVTLVPEPGIWTLAAAGLGTLLACRLARSRHRGNNPRF